jgi:hypothetical protein
MFLLLTDFHSGKKSLVNFDSVRKIDIFQESYSLVTFNDPATPMPCKEPFDVLCETILRSNSVPEYITGTENVFNFERFAGEHVDYLKSNEDPPTFLNAPNIPEWQIKALDFWKPTPVHSEQYVDEYLKIKNELTPESDQDTFLSRFNNLPIR